MTRHEGFEYFCELHQKGTRLYIQTIAPDGDIPQIVAKAWADITLAERAAVKAIVVDRIAA
ncbi:MAG: hypothetical protein EHM35_00200 [Planctomycetaceae bacterium]|nr:MAG: hypothetical protein EHM35_00200 [Planctomycetaceae bacterium]